MRSRLLRGALALLIGLSLAAGGIVPRLALKPAETLAADATVSTCSFAAFSSALSDVQSSGGGTVTFDCAGTITFTSQQTITSDVTIDGGGQVTFDGNQATRLFAVDAGATLDLTGLTVQQGSAESGGAIENLGTLTVTASTFSNNSASQFRYGGAIYSEGTLTVTDSAFEGNSAGFGGAIYGGGVLAVTGTSFEANSASFAGAIRNIGTLTVTAGIFSINSASIDGGAIYNAGTLTVTASTFEGNSAGNDGGAIHNPTVDTLTVTASTFTENSALADGGAIYNPIDGIVSVTASTFEDNSANDDGGAIYNRDMLTVTASTFSANSAAAAGGTILNTVDGEATVRSTILAGSGPGEICFGTITSAGYNLSSDTNCGFGDTSSQQGPGLPINLGPLQDNGGPTHTMQPLTGSAAIDAIPAGDCQDVSTSPDQRGVSRPQGPACDIGAVEAPPAVVLCANRFTGAISAPPAGGGCAQGNVLLTLPAAGPVTLCINPYTVTLVWSPSGNCPQGWLMHIVPDDGPLHYCQSLYTGRLRYSPTGQCNAFERPGVIPG